MKKILLIEDDSAIQKALKLFFESENYGIDIAPDGSAGLDAFHASHPDLVILDLMLPQIPGEEVCREIKKKVPSQPLIVISARCEDVDKVLPLELGADDYLPKPFSLKELLARVHAVTRSRAVESPAEFSFED